MEVAGVDRAHKIARDPKMTLLLLCDKVSPLNG